VVKSVGPSRWSAVEAISFMDSVCDQQHFRRYEYIPPKMVAGCKRLLDLQGEEFEAAMERGGSFQALATELCTQHCSAAGVVFQIPDDKVTQAWHVY
jgi:hypothetical protein